MTLIPVDRTLGRALLKNRSHAERLTSGLLHGDFPDEDLSAKLPAFVQRLEHSANPALGSTAPPDPRGWGLWLFFLQTRAPYSGRSFF